MPIFSALPSPPSIFPTYLIPSLPFRRRRSSADTTASAGSSSSTDSGSLGTSPPTYLHGNSSHLRCSRCLTDLCLTSQIISKGFTGRHGRAYLVAPPPPHRADLNGGRLGSLPNTHTHKPVPRQLVTGAHTVSDISCAQCDSVLGWKYVAAEEESQRYKVGKFILETKRVCKAVSWENEELDADIDHHSASRSSSKDDQEIEFDSQDEDECEDLFAGVWTAQLAKKRRQNRRLSGSTRDDDLV